MMILEIDQNPPRGRGERLRGGLSYEGAPGFAGETLFLETETRKLPFREKEAVNGLSRACNCSD